MNRLGFESHPAATVSEAKELILTEGAGFYDCVLTDYRMPDGNGLELLVWIRERDRTLATIILTGEGDKEVVEMTLKKGASAYLEKPASLATLKEALGRAVAETSERRHLAEAQRQADKVGEALHDLLGIAELKALPHLEISYHPHSRAGGDSLSRILLPDERELLLLADVSGHDLSAAYVSAYFQGLVRGLTEKGDHIREVSDFVNNFLLNEWSRKFRNDSGSVVQTSIAVCGIDIDRTSQKVGIMNCGSPVPLLSDSEGSVVELGTGSPPLGWYNELDTEWIRHAFDEGSHLLLWSAVSPLQPWPIDFSTTTMRTWLRKSFLMQRMTSLSSGWIFQPTQESQAAFTRSSTPPSPAVTTSASINYRPTGKRASSSRSPTIPTAFWMTCFSVHEKPSSMPSCMAVKAGLTRNADSESPTALTTLP